MTKWRLFYVFAMIVCIIGAAAIAGDSDNKQDRAMSNFGPTGPPDEMKQIANFAGTWDVVMSWKMDPASEEWNTSRATAIYMSVLDGCGIHYTYTEKNPESKFEGSCLLAFSRETGKWQSMWMDNMSAAMSLYEGDFKNGEMVVSDQDYWNGMKYISRMTIYNITNNRFEWKYEMSMDDGKTFATTGKAVYSRAK